MSLGAARGSQMSDGTEVRAALGSGPKSSKGKVLAWALWDWGTQPFYTVITTFVFSVYITSSAFAGDGDPNWPTQALSLAVGFGGVVIALLAPVLGQASDRTGHTVRDLRLMTWAIAVISAALYFVEPNPAFLWLGLGLLVVGTIIGEIASVHNNALLEQVADEQNVGKVSGFGWGMGYMGGIITLLLLLVVFIQPDSGPFGITEPSMSPFRIRLAMVACGIWTLVFTIPLFVSVRDRAPLGDQPKRLGIIGSYRALFKTIAGLWKTQRHTVYFLLASALFRDGLAGVFTFGAVIAARSFGMDTQTIILCGAAANLVAGLVTMLFGLLDDRLGPKFVILLCLAVLVVSELLIFFLHRPGYALTPEMAGYDPAVSAQGHLIFWVVGLIASSVCGPAQAAARSFLARNIPEGHSGEIFGLYATTGRAISFVSPFLVFVFVTIGAGLAGNEAAAQHWAAVAMALLLVLGFAVMLPVKERQQLGNLD
jgi:UMF1 family MFS transporter